jgi:chromosome segregation protein
VLVPKVLTDYHAREMPDENVLSRIDDLLQVVERMGEINLTAIDEYEERSQRHEKLTEQRKDLESALTQLETAIRRMNRESRRLFRETFHEVNKLFQKMFPVIFGGGQAELRLTDPDDLLESGIDIVAMPPGKKLGMLELMSGGEKALTAISLILALFQYKPTPFCLLDEVDAPLDEANIGRFSQIVKEMTSRSQFIIITHSRQTVMIADVLYGITMETPGISKVVSVQLGENGEKRPMPHLDKNVAVA